MELRGIRNLCKQSHEEQELKKILTRYIDWFTRRNLSSKKNFTEEDTSVTYVTYLIKRNLTSDYIYREMRRYG